MSCDLQCFSLKIQLQCQSRPFLANQFSIPPDCPAVFPVMLLVAVEGRHTDILAMINRFAITVSMLSTVAPSSVWRIGRQETAWWATRSWWWCGRGRWTIPTWVPPTVSIWHWCLSHRHMPCWSLLPWVIFPQWIPALASTPPWSFISMPTWFSTISSLFMAILFLASSMLWLLCFLLPSLPFFSWVLRLLLLLIISLLVGLGGRWLSNRLPWTRNRIRSRNYRWLFTWSSMLWGRNSHIHTLRSSSWFHGWYNPGYLQRWPTQRLPIPKTLFSPLHTKRWARAPLPMLK